MARRVDFNSSRRLPFEKLAIAIASSPTILNNVTMALPAAVYALIALFTAAGFGFLVNRAD